MRYTRSAFPYDISQFNDDMLIYYCVLDCLPALSYETKQEIKNVLGHLAYVLEGAKRLFNVPSYKIRVTHDEVIEDGKNLSMVW